MAISQYPAASWESNRRNRNCLPEIAPQGHFLALRAVGTTGKPHPQIRQVALPLLHELAEWIPEVFSDLDEKTKGEKHESD